MPSWGLHVCLVKEVNSYLKMDESLLVIGSVLPDINNGYVVHPVSQVLPGIITHFRDTDRIIDLNSFLSCYQSYLNQAVVMGYYLHLLLDNYWDSVMRSCYDLEETAHKKFHDFEVLENYLLCENDITLSIATDDLLLEKIIIQEVSLNDTDILKSIDYLNQLHGQPCLDDYFLFSKEEYLMYWKKGTDSITKQLRRVFHN